MRKFNISVNGKSYEVDVEEVGGVSTPAPAPVQTAAPMPGTIVSVKVNVGDKVEAGTLVAVLEAMKMENEIFAGVDGTVAGISVSAGDSVNSGDVIVSVN